MISAAQIGLDDFIARASMACCFGNSPMSLSRPMAKGNLQEIRTIEPRLRSWLRMHPRGPIGRRSRLVGLLIVQQPYVRGRIPGQRTSELHGQIRQNACASWRSTPCSRSATGFPREPIADKKSNICRRIAGATCFSRSFSVLSSGYSSNS